MTVMENFPTLYTELSICSPGAEGPDSAPPSSAEPPAQKPAPPSSEPEGVLELRERLRETPPTPTPPEGH